MTTDWTLTTTAPSWAWIALAIGAGVLFFFTIGPLLGLLGGLVRHLWARRPVLALVDRGGHVGGPEPRCRVYDWASDGTEASSIGEAIVVDFRAWQTGSRPRPGGAA